jgi:hypothetical protein
VPPTKEQWKRKESEFQTRMLIKQYTRTNFFTIDANKLKIGEKSGFSDKSKEAALV